MSFKPLSLALALTLMLSAGCSKAEPVIAGASLAGTGAILAAANDDQLDSGEKASLEAISEEITARFFADEAADPKWTGANAALVGPKGGLLYRGLHKSSLLRKVGYAVSQPVVHRHFSKPGKTDDVPVLSADERAELTALLQPGDLIQCGNNASFVHVIFYVGDGEIVHSLAQSGFGKKMIGVRRETLKEYLDRSERDKVVVLRPTYAPEQLATAIAYARAQVGKDYDTLFLTDAEDRFYCTELAYAIVNKAGVAKVEPHLATKAKWRLITNEDLRKSPDFKVVYRRNHD